MLPISMAIDVKKFDLKIVEIDQLVGMEMTNSSTIYNEKDIAKYS